MCINKHIKHKIKKIKMVFKIIGNRVFMEVFEAVVIDDVRFVTVHQCVNNSDNIITVVSYSTGNITIEATINRVYIIIYTCNSTSI